ncbi:MAG: YceD family protein [Moorellaceae bacterium]
MRVEVAEVKLKRGNRVKFDFCEAWSELRVGGERIPLTEPVSVEGEITNTGKFLSLKGRVSTTLQLRCNRCLEAFSQVIDVPLGEEYCTPSVYASLPPGDELRDEVRVYEGDSIDVGPVVDQALILALPMKWVCRDECLGLCPYCGQNLNEQGCHCRPQDIDPRLEVLARLLAREKKGGL